MATIIDPTYFIDELELTVDNIDIQSFINKHEPDILDKSLGVELADEFKTGLAVEPTPLAKWTDLRDGKVFTNSSGNKERYKGIFLIITDYVYHKIIAKIQSEATDSGVKIALADNAGNGSPRDKMLFADNDMIDRIAVMDDFINKTNEDTPDTYENYLPGVFEKENLFDL